MKKNVYLRQLEFNTGHWWFESRKEVIRFFLKKKFMQKKADILDFGCGVGINFEMLKEFGKVHFYDKNKNIANQNKNRFNSNNFKHIVNLEKSKKKFDLIVALDVIEHVKNDKKIIKILSNKLKKKWKNIDYCSCI